MWQSWKWAAAASIGCWLGMASYGAAQGDAPYDAGNGYSLHYSAPIVAPHAPAPAPFARQPYLEGSHAAQSASASSVHSRLGGDCGCGSGAPCSCGAGCSCDAMGDSAGHIAHGCADASCVCGDCCEEAQPWRLFQNGTILGFGLTGWIEAGAAANGRNPPSRYNGPVTFADREEGYLNQLYAVLENPFDAECGCWDFGGRIDFLFGTDARFTKAIGLELDQNGGESWNAGHSFYQVALPQFYAQVGNDRVNVMAGHFYTIIGYEGVMAPGNFFYTHAYTHQYGEPFTHTGALATWKYSDMWRLVGGIHFGWDVFDSAVDRVGFLGGAYFTPTEDITVAFTMTTGDELAFNNLLANRTMYSLVGGFDLTERLQWVLQHDYGWQDNATGQGLNAQWYGVNNYLFYTINDEWRAGVRFEWFDDADGTRVFGIGAGNPAQGPFIGDFYECTVGLNWLPGPNWTIRPELRWDWFDGDNASPRPFDDGRSNSQFLAAIDLIFLW